jgi:beta-galactosidase/beta-glucuronidase
MKLNDAVRTLLFHKKSKEYHQLYTKWGESMQEDHVLTEYPRPQMRRSSYTILNGCWKYCITKEPSEPEGTWGRILVPFSPESILSGVNRQVKPGEFLWYERTLSIEQKYAGSRCILQFGAVDQECEVFVNRVKVYKHRGGYLPFSVDITDSLRKGENLLALRVTDDSDTGLESRGKQKLHRGGMFYTAQSGIWQTVWMEWVPDRYIKEIRITPYLDLNAVSLDIIMNGGNEDAAEPNPIECNSSQMYRVEIFADNRPVASKSSKNPRMTISIPEDRVECWSPENPFLYDMVITVGKDRVESYFAMRKIEIKQDEENIPRIFLNNRPYFQNGLLDQGYWPDGLYTAPDDAALVFDIVLAKKLGFNMLRKHLKIEPLRWYYHCDRLGMLVWQDMVNGGGRYRPLLVSYLPTLLPGRGVHIKDNKYRLLGRKEEEARREWMAQCKETVKHLYNCPCIVVWVPFNEGWGQFDSEKIVKEMKTVDKSRLIDHASGWFDQGTGDFKSIHNYFHPLKVVHEKRPVVLSEYGGYACYIGEHSYSMQIYGYRICRTKEAFNVSYRMLLSQVIGELTKQGLSAAVYTQLSDVEDEVNGLVTYDRKVCKVDGEGEDFRGQQRGDT